MVALHGDVFHLALSFLRVEELVRLQRVSRAWTRSAEVALEQLPYLKIVLESAGRAPNADLEKLRLAARHCRRLRRLELECLDTLSEDTLGMIRHTMRSCAATRPLGKPTG